MEGRDDGVAVAEQTNGNITHDLHSLLSSSERDFLIRNNGDQVKIESLNGKKVGLYFSASWCGACQQFTPNLVEVYNELSSNGDFEIVFVSADEDEDEQFKGYFSEMPWLAIPFSDSEKRERLDELFNKVMEIPYLVILDESGKVLTKEGVTIVRCHGADAYPFTEERLMEIKAQQEEMAKGWPEKLKRALHEHELVLTRREQYVCDGCEEVGNVWSFYCGECDFDLHPKCALEDDKGTEGETEEDVEGKKTKE